MSKNLTFMEYVESKEVLLNQLKSTPQDTKEYTVTTYCKLPVGDDLQEKVQVSLKPNSKIIVDWLYEDVNNPTPLNIRFEGAKDIDDESTFMTFWKNEKLQKWISRNTKMKR